MLVNPIPQYFLTGCNSNGVVDCTTQYDASITRLKALGGGAMVLPVGTGYLAHGQVKLPGIYITTANFPSYDYVGGEPTSPMRVYTQQAGGAGIIAVSAIVVNGTETPFTSLGYGDGVALSGVVFSGPDVSNPVCATNIISRWRGLPPGINWGIEIDMNNEYGNSGGYFNPRYGQALVINTGSNYIPDTGIVIQRTNGEGTGPGYAAGIQMTGVRDIGLYIQTMDPASFPGMIPAAPGSMSVMVLKNSSETYNRFTLNNSGRMDFGSGASAQDTTIQRAGSGGITITGLVETNTSFWVSGKQVVAAQQAYIADPTGGATVDTEARTVITYILGTMKTHGLIASS